MEVVLGSYGVRSIHRTLVWQSNIAMDWNRPSQSTIFHIQRGAPQCVHYVGRLKYTNRLG